LALGLVDRSVGADEFADIVSEEAEAFARRDPSAYRSIKGLIRGPIIEKMAAREAASIREFVDIWYSESTRKKLEEVKIHP
jgi:hypothetical protein